MRILVCEDAAGVESVAARVATLARVAAVERTRDLPHAAAASADAVIVGPALARAADTLAAIGALAAERPGLPVIVVGADARAEAAVAAMRAGAADYVVGVEALGPALARLGAGERPRRAARAALAATDPLDRLVGRSAAMQSVRTLVRTVARSDASVLLEGETGTGKEVVARAVHAASRRAAGPFVPVNCAAVPESLAEAEFFGHVRGAFTGALQERPGVVELADRGTLFLDEIEDLSAALQAKLLRVVQDREVRPLGGRAFRRVDVRLVAASNRDLRQMVTAGAFRQDLFFRLRVLAIRLPPLRERRDDIPLLVEHFVDRFNARHGTSFVAPTGAALRPLLEHTWPGNVRELENTLEAMLTVAAASGSALSAVPPATGLLGDERTRIVQALDEHRWNRQRAAAALGISRVTLWRRMGRHGIRDPLAPPRAIGDRAPRAIAERPDGTHA
jgi:DNA-binding NtrC family response regulator